MSRVSHKIDRLEVVFDDESLVADAGLLTASTLMDRLGLEDVVDEVVRLGGRAGAARPGRKVLTLVASMLLGGSHIDHADRLRAGSTGRVLPFRPMASSTVGTFLRSYDLGSCPSAGQSPDRGAAPGMERGRRTRRRGAGDN